MIFLWTAVANCFTYCYINMTDIMCKFIWITSLVSLVQGSHFRGALFSWSPNGDGSINIDFRISWRRSSSNCDDSTISENTLVVDSGSIECIVGCEGTLGGTSFFCTDYSIEQDWTTGRNTLVYTPASKQFSFGFSGGAWISLIGAGGGSWNFIATVDLRPRSDTGKPNTSPTVDMAPVVQLMHGCQHTIIIPVSDADGDVIRCRWAKGEECADVCMAFSDSSLDESSCVLTYTADDEVGYYAVALQIEDFTDESSTTPLSSIPIQFLVRVFQKSGSNCFEKPNLIQPTPSDGACYSTQVDGLMSVTIKAKSAQRLSSITTISAVGMVRSPETITHESSAFYMSVEVTWIPSLEDLGKDHSLCFYATDENGLVSNTRCIHVPVSVGRPKIANVTYEGSTKTWEIMFNQKFLIPTAPALLEVYEKRTGKVVHTTDVTKSTDVVFDPQNMNMSVTFNFTFEPTTKYYVLIPEGLVGRQTSCGTLSEAVDDTKFWEIESGIDCGCPEIANGTIHAPNGTYHPSVIRYECDSGFRLNGNGTRECQGNGTWSGCDPFCISHGSVIKNFFAMFKVAMNRMITVS